MVFASREDAGQKLGRFLKEQETEADLVVGLPRGGVIVAAEVARILERPLDVLIVRKIGHPLHREFAVGALAENDVVLLDETVIGNNPMVRTELTGIIAEEKARLQSYRTRFHCHNLAQLRDKAVLLVDDGLATGATTQAAVLSARKQGARRITVTAPVASTHAVERLQQVADAVVVLWADSQFDAVGRYYEHFVQTTDEEVLERLQAA